ncbi:Gfo/Idh/MocA family oxidoreductase [Gordonia rhizosphera]|uniref:Putative myo-inositol 2-dehydrogenase n=1 Tax=Gordonia rhizosphera NBRC 16068 TaxID=1108045 RepID=K6WGP5_9ACTN|nr:Gfo/Idh/MocA family oxidoreductase [Gordonia rhizosphera]GAB92946.1 putative myo-inositol 2-dehydrogenase [Gordonia rhizosphera NBRC 16068]
MTSAPSVATATTPHRPNAPVRIATIGAGRIGSSHTALVARHVYGAIVTAVADPVDGAAARLADAVDAPFATTDIDEVLVSPEVDAVLITAPARSHSDLVCRAAAAGKHVFCEKPMAVTLDEADRAIAAAEAAGVVLQVGFNRRFAPGFAAARRAVDDGRVGTPQLLRSLTRDPGPWEVDPVRVPQWTIFLETLIHDFDTLCFLNPGARPVSVHAFADALIRPDAKASGHLDTAVVTITFDNGAIATAEASFSALYGYDVRGEVFGSKGMATAGDGRTTDMTFYGAAGVEIDTARRDTDLLHDAYVGELSAFADAVRTGSTAVVSGHDARTALQIALAAIRSIETGATVSIAEIA